MNRDKIFIEDVEALIIRFGCEFSPSLPHSFPYVFHGLPKGGIFPKFEEILFKDVLRSLPELRVLFDV